MVKRLFSFLLCIVAMLFSVCSCNSSCVVPAKHPKVEQVTEFVSSLSQTKDFRFDSYPHDLLFGFPEDTENCKYVDDYFFRIQNDHYYDSSNGVLYRFRDSATPRNIKSEYYRNVLLENISNDRADTAYREICYNNKEFQYDQTDKMYYPVLTKNYDNISADKDVYYFNCKLENDCDYNSIETKPYLITPWCEELQYDYMDYMLKNDLIHKYDKSKTIPASFYMPDGVCAYQYGVSIFYDDYAVRAIAYKDTDEARAEVDEFCEFFGVPTPAEYYG